MGVGSPDNEVVGEPLGCTLDPEAEESAAEAVLDAGESVSVVVETILAASKVVLVTVVVVRSKAESVDVLKQC